MIYRVVIPGNPLAVPLRAVVIYDGSFTLPQVHDGLTQTIGGFYQASSNPQAKMTQIVSNGQTGFRETVAVNGLSVATNPFTGVQGVRWDNPTFNITVNSGDSSLTTQVTRSNDQVVCLTWGAIIMSVNVTDTDHDGLLDVWETKGLHLNPGTSTIPATFGGCSDYPTEPCVNLPAMGASSSTQDIFVEIDWMHGNDGKDHLHKANLDALTAIAATFKLHNIKVHFDVGNNYQSSAVGPDYVIVPYTANSQGGVATAQGGEVIEESTLLCPNAQTSVCSYPGLNYSVLGWKVGFEGVKNGFPALNIPPHFSHIRKDIFHYALFGHALAVPCHPPTGLQRAFRAWLTGPAAIL